MLNKILLIGRNTSDGILRFTPSGAAKYENTIAVDRKYRDKEGNKKTDFIRYEVWQKQAEACANYTKKGTLIAVEGELHIDVAEKDGQKQYYTKVNCDTVRFLSPKDSHAGEGANGPVDNEIPF